MDESRHPEREIASINTTNAFSNEESESTGDPSNADAQSPSKRPHSDDTPVEPSPKKAHIDPEVHEAEEAADELDLDALMAQLQQHTEQATGGSTHTDTAPENPGENANAAEHNDLAFHVDSIESVLKDLGNVEQSHSETTNKDETELSIEQQLKGALSSLEFEGDDDIGLDQLSQLLKTTEDKKSEKQDGDGDVNDGGDTEGTEKQVESNANIEGDKPTAESNKPPEGGQNIDQTTSIQLEAQPGAQPESKGPTEKPTELTEPNTEHQTGPHAEHTIASAGVAESTPSITEPTSRRESLISKMPPPPILHGQLPPMPPPPAAFNSPVAPYPLGESRESEGADAGPSAAVNKTQPATQVPVFSDPPAQLSAEYKKNLIDQLEKASREPQEEPSDDRDKAEEQDKEDKEKKDTDGGQEGSDRSGKDAEGALPDDTAPRPIPALFLNDNKAILQSRRRSLLLLDSLACQVLETLSFSHYQETLSTVMQPESERGMVYRILLDAFEDVKRIYMKWETHSSRITPQPKPEGSRPFLPYNLAGVEPTRDNLITIQRANMATFVAALFGSIEIGFWELDDWFIRVFVPENGRLLKQQANIYLDLKTQAYISAVESTDDKEAHKAALEHLFPLDLETKMQYMFGVRIHLAPTEKDFVAKCHRRRDNILSENNVDLPTKYHWVPFLREVSDYISRNHLTLLPPRKHSILPREVESSGAHSAPSGVPDSASVIAPRNYPVPRRQAPAPSSRASIVQPQGADEDKRGSEEVEVMSVKSSSAGRPAKAEITDSVQSNDPTKTTAHQARNDKGRDRPESTVGTPVAGTPVTGTSAAQSPSGGTPANGTPSGTPAPDAGSSERPLVPSEGHPMFPPLPKQVLPPPTSGSSSPLPDSDRLRRPGPKPHTELPPSGKHSDTLAAYEAAKASAEGTDAIRPKTSMFTTRRTWTKQEEEALLKGMDRVQGPYWAQILELYGPGGKISEVLKDRSQVQLKDKARNLKMFFVRLGLPIPAVFQYVTGDYETRRTSGRKMRDRRQQQQQQQQHQQQQQPVQQQPPRAGPSGFSQVHSPAQPPLRDTQGTDHIQERSNQQGNTSSTNPASNPDFNHSQVIEPGKEQMTAQPPVVPVSTTTSGPEQAKLPIPERRASEQSKEQSSPKKISEPNIPGQNVPTQDAGEILEQSTPGQNVPTPTVHASSQNGPDRDVQSSQEDTPGGNEHNIPGNPGEPSTQTTESNTAAADGKFTDIFGDSNDKDDLNTLLNRVGEYVDNH